MIENYLLKHAFFEQKVFAPIVDSAMIIVIPAYNEANVITTLQSLIDAEQCKDPYEILVVFNHPDNASEEVKKSNRSYYSACMHWIDEQKLDHIHLIKAFDLPVKYAGVGLARKIGMDEALRRSNVKENTVLVGLDADCTVASNYLVAIEAFFKERPHCDGASIHFEHPLGELKKEDLSGIVHYELHLRYYNQLLRFAGHPYAFHTVGSSMAVRAGAYYKQGGMNKRKAGEDFYFLQKIIQLGNFGEISNTCVYPSARISERVPFGTGRAMLEWLSNEDKHFMTYHPDSAVEMKKLFTRLYNNKRALCVEDIPDCFIQFLGTETWVSKLEEIRLNTNTDDAYIQRFFKWFNLFMCFKFVHFYRDNYQKNISIKEAVIKFAPMIGLDLKDEESELRFLQIFRKWEGRC